MRTTVQRQIIAISLSLVWLLASQGASAQDTTLSTGTFFKGTGGIDPIERTNRAELMFLELVFDSLLTLDADGTLDPRLATDWVATDDSITFTLRDDVTFSDGTPFNAEAAKANLERGQAEGAAMIQADLARVESIDVLDEFSLRLTLSERDPFLLRRLSGFAGMMASPESFDSDGLGLIGSGPYVLNEADSLNRSLYVFERNPLYWDADSVQFERIEWRVLTAIGAVNGLLSGDIDISTLPAGVVPLVAEQTEIYSTQASLYMGLIMDRDGTVVPALGSREVRCALNHAVDRESFAEITGPLVFEPMETVIPSTWYGYAPDAATYPYDPARARELLAAAGAGDLTLDIPTTESYRVQYEPFVGLLNDVGITVTTEIVQSGEIFTITWGGEVALGYLSFSPDHISLFVQDYFLEEGVYNPFNVVDPEIEALAEQALALPFAEAEPLWQEIVRIIQRECYMIPLASGTYPAVTAEYVEGEKTRPITPGYIDLRAVTINR